MYGLSLLLCTGLSGSGEAVSETGAGGVEQAEKNIANTARQPGSSLFAFMEIRLPYIMISPPLYIRFFESVKFHIDKLSFEKCQRFRLKIRVMMPTATLRSSSRWVMTIATSSFFPGVRGSKQEWATALTPI